MENQKQNKSTQYLLIALLLLSLIGNVFQYKNNQDDVAVRDSKIDTLVTVQVELEKELVSTGAELESYRGIAANLDSLLDDANGKIEAQEAKINKLLTSEKSGDKLNKKLKAELEQLRKLKDQYLEKIDQLITENGQLKKENEEKAAAITKLNEEKTGLQSKVATASQLRAEYVKVASFKKKGNGKFVETSLAKRTNKIDVSLTIMDNKVAEPGDKMIYVVVKEPTGKTLAGASMAKFNVVETNEEVAATASYRVNYNGQKQDIKVSFETDERILTAGNYTIDVYIDGTFVNTSTCILR
jgi:predicted  nucleic acid-binding Zn-ribbon protein